MAKKILVYSTTTCPYCSMAKDFLKEHNIKFESIDVTSDRAKQKEMIDKSGQMGVPVIDIDGTIILGFDEQRLRELLNIK